MWNHSRLRFYILNTMWNYKFWLFSKKIYKNISYYIEDGEYNMDFDYKMKKDKKMVTKKRFLGYFFENNLYLDNPGFKIDDRDTWESWKKKKLVK